MPRRDGSLGEPVWVRRDIARVIEQTWQHISSPGTWLSGQTRIAVAAEVRMAHSCAQCHSIKEALSPIHGTDGDHATFGQLPATWVEVIHRLATDHSRLTEQWLRERVISKIVTDAEYVEIVSICALTTAIDTFSRIIGEAEQELPTPVDGEPTQYRPDNAVRDIAWVPTIHPDAAAGPEATLYFEQSGAHIHRALSLVPAEKRAFFALDDVFYLPDRALRRFDREYRAINHAQIELLAARVSAINQCYY